MENKSNLVRKKLGHISHSFSIEDLERYGKDWTNYYTINPLVILFPKNTEEVQEIILFANEFNIPIVPSGGRTGLSGGAVASNLEMVVSLEKMNKILSFNEANQSLLVEAGVITEEIQMVAIENGLLYPIDFASKGSSQIGGNISTNAGGINVLKYGLTRNYVSGLTFVTAKGQILELNQGLIKNATGYDLRHLIIGSEGTLGIITRATIQLIKSPESLNVLFLGLVQINHILEILSLLKKNISITAFEFICENALEYNLKETNTIHPFAQKSPYYILIEFENEQDAYSSKIEECISYFYEKGYIQDDIFAQQSAEMERIWQYRERITDSIAKYTPYKNDIAILPSLVPLFIQNAEQILKKEYKEFRVLWFGHIGDGNIHISILKPSEINAADFYNKCAEASKILFALIKKLKGSISAEHGIGLLKKEFIGYTKSEDEIEYLKAIKKIFDPNNIMNPGKIV